MSAARKKAVRKKPVRKKPVRPAREQADADEELRERLVALGQEKGYEKGHLGSHGPGLARLQMWVSAYAEGVLVADPDPDPGPRGVIPA